MKILINQYFGIGDVIFCMTIARRWINEGHTVTWPVFPQFVEGLQRAYPDVTFIDWRSIKIDYGRKDEHDSLGYRVVPLRWNVEIMNVPYDRCMETKYTMFNIDYREWRELAMWNRDNEKENVLYESYKGKNKGYNLVNETWGSDCKNTKGIITNNGLPTLYMNVLSEYSLFDWALVLERATEIHTVSTSIIYLLELLDINCPIHLYPRLPQERDFRNVDYLFTKPYILHL